MRILAAVLLALLAAGPAPASKPPAESDYERVMIRSQAVAECTAQEMSRDRDLSRGSPLGDCQCAVDRYMEGRDLAALRPLISRDSKGLLDQALAQCRNGSTRGDLDEATEARGTTPGADPSPAANDRGAAAPRFEPAAWLEGISLPRWTWAAIPALIIGLILLLGRRRRSDDLLGPPPSMRPGADPDSPDDPRA